MTTATNGQQTPDIAPRSVTAAILGELSMVNTRLATSRDAQELGGLTRQRDALQSAFDQLKSAPAPTSEPAQNQDGETIQPAKIKDVMALRAMISDLDSEIADVTGSKPLSGVLTTLKFRRDALHRVVNALDSVSEPAQVVAKEQPTPRRRASELLYNFEVKQLSEALEQSDELDAIVSASQNDRSVPEEEFEKLCLRQRVAWALVRQLCFVALDVTDFNPPICVDIGDAIIIVYGYQDNGSGNNDREMDAGWTASRRIARPEPVRDRASEDESEEAKEEAKEEEGEAAEGIAPISAADIHDAIELANTACNAVHAMEDNEVCRNAGPESDYQTACWERIRSLVLTAAGQIPLDRSVAEAEASDDSELGPAGVITDDVVILAWTRGSAENSPIDVSSFVTIPRNRVVMLS